MGIDIHYYKTELMLLGKACTHWTTDWWPPQWNSAPIPVTTVKNLGIKLDSNLLMTDQTNSIISSCNYSLRLLSKILPYLPFSYRRTLVQAMVISRLDYGNALLAEASGYLLNKLQVIQNTAARMILNLPPRTPSAPLLKSLHWLPVKKRSFFKICCLTFNAIRCEGPRYLQEKISKHISPLNLRSNQLALLNVPRIRRNRSGGRSFSYLAPKYWNSLPFHVKLCPSRLSFRKMLKAFLF